MARNEAEIPPYPDAAPVTLAHGPALKPLLQALASPVSEFTFANIYLFRKVHAYRLSVLDGGRVVISGADGDEPFFMLPFGAPSSALGGLFGRFGRLKNASEGEAAGYAAEGYRVEEDRAGFDYLYSRREMAELAGRRFHRKKNLVNAFLAAHSCEERELTAENSGDAAAVLDKWRAARKMEADYAAAREALGLMAPLGLSGRLYYVDGAPAAYALGEPAGGVSYILHFEKGVEGLKGLTEFVFSRFAASLPETVETINMEQDLGDEGLRRAKAAYRPAGFVKKFIVRPPRPSL